MADGIMRSFFDDEGPDTRKNVRRMHMGTKHSGIIMDVHRKGVEISGYYSLENHDRHYSCLKDPVFIPWEELDKMKSEVLKKRKSGDAGPDFVDETPDIAYLKTLPKVHINKMLFYIDATRRERRLVDRPTNVFRF